MFDINQMPSWYSKIEMSNGNVISGAAAFNHRVKLAGGMNNILLNVAFYAAQNTFNVLNQQNFLPKIQSK